MKLLKKNHGYAQLINLIWIRFVFVISIPITYNAVYFVLQDPNLLTIDFKKYLLAEYMLQKATNKDDLIVLAFKVNNTYII